MTGNQDQELLKLMSEKRALIALYSGLMENYQQAKDAKRRMEREIAVLTDKIDTILQGWLPLPLGA